MPGIVFTNYGEAPTAALLGIALLLTLQARENRDPWAVAQAALVLAAVANVKQTGLVVVALGAAGAGLLVLADRQPGLRRRLLGVAAALLPAILVWLLWRRHAAAATGGFAFRPPAEWLWDLAPRTLASMGRVAMSKAAFTLLLLGAALAGLRVLGRGPRSRAGAAALVFGAAGLGWAATLFLLYMGASFYPSEVAAAASFWRYMTQFAGCAGVVLALALLEWRAPVAWLAARWTRLSPSRRGHLRHALPLLVLLLPALAFSRLWPPAREVAPPLRRAAVELRPQVEGARGVAVIDPLGNGMSRVVLAFAWREVVPTHWLSTLPAAETLPAEEWLRRVEGAAVDFVMLCSTDEGVQRAFGTGPLPRRGWRLMRREGAGWREVAEGGWH